MEPRYVSRSLIDPLRSFVRERCPCALEDKTFFPTFVAIVDCEMEKVIERERVLSFRIGPELVAKHGHVIRGDGSQKTHPEP